MNLLSFSFKWDQNNSPVDGSAKDGRGLERCACPLMWSSTFPAGFAPQGWRQKCREYLDYKLWVRGVFSALTVAAGNVCGMRRIRSSALTSFRLDMGWAVLRSKE